VVRQLRRAVGWTQAELADRAGLSLRGVADLERGINRHPRRETLLALTQAFALTDEDRDRFFTAARRQPVDPSVSSSPLTPTSTAESHESIVDPLPPPTFPTGTVTLLFTDIEGSTRLLRHLGEAYAHVLGAHQQVLREAWAEYGGIEVDSAGDGFFVAFSTALAAVSAAAAGTRSLAKYSWPEGGALRVRIGLHTGEPLLASEGYVGLDVHRAARIMSAGHGGQVLVSQTTRDLVADALPSGVSLHDLGEHRLKDLENPVHLFQLVIDGLAADFPAPRTLDTHPHNLPIQPTPFIGREQAVSSVLQTLMRPEVRLLTLTGPGGVGKTRLALQVAAEASEHFVDGTWFVPLAPLRAADLVLSTIGQTLELEVVGGQAPLEQVKQALGEKSTLLLLDNFEHVAEAAVLVAELLAACPQLTILVTSREPLHLLAEHEFAVPELALPDLQHLPDLPALSQYEAVALFIERARAVKPDFAVTNANAPAVAEICARLDGLPLAIELAAVRSKLLSPHELLARLGQSLQLLTSSTRDVPVRQRTLRSAIQWSYDLLGEQEQHLFRWLSVFRGGCTLLAVESVAAMLGDDLVSPLDRIASLLDKSLLRQTAQETEKPRLLMLETIREFALEYLAASGERAAARQAHASYYLALAEEAAPALKGPQHAAWVHRLARDYDNLRATMQWTLEQVGSRPEGIELALKVRDSLTEFWNVRGLYMEAWTFLEPVAIASEDAAPALRARALRAAAEYTPDQNLRRCAALWQECLEIYQELGDKRGIADALSSLALIERQMGGPYAAAAGRLEERLALAREFGDKEDIASALFSHADALGFLGEFRRARLLFEESLALRRELGNKRGAAWSLYGLAMWLFIEHDPADQLSARDRLEESLALSQQSGDKTLLGLCAWLNGWMALYQGDLDTAEAQLEQSLRLWRETNEVWRAVWAHALLGRAATQHGDLARARALHQESLQEAGTFADHFLIAFCLDGLAETLAREGHHTWAARTWGAAESYLDRSGVPRTLYKIVNYETNIADLRARMGEPTFAAAWDEGQSLTLAQILVETEN
jgi:predicted ATPase/class 3 adenylate cyclase/DNA-binding XRE family transcriptional regulator